ncbi:hypothetical protein CONLIGDRAFT_266474 [Coniochaeta ligniaria NRRL 30616]|uniref:Uncharacterized protein n=1 Tax=Coniochaeta ligniaria NRRL 30616 TaxID=1408157 RepID=A0A1J7JX14_9PEZI|nr:hypothetical protein CONLIGDRAFT_266474 [Coniochaeta ligniaria NRRL 30616]
MLRCRRSWLLKVPSEDNGPDGHKPHRIHQASKSLELSKSYSVPGPQKSSSTRSASFKEDISGRGALATTDSTETGAKVMQRNHSMAMGTTASLNIDPLEVPLDGSEPISSTENALGVGSLSTEQQEVAGYGSNEHEDIGISDSRPTTVIGSLGKTIASMVGEQLALESSGALDSSKSDSARLEQGCDEGGTSTSRSLLADQLTESDETLATLHNSETGAAGQQDDRDVVKRPSLEEERQPESITAPEFPNTAKSDEARSSGLQEATSRSVALSQQSNNDDSGAEALTQNYPQAPDSAYSDDQLAMTGHEAIPGTITHGSDDSRSEIIEPISGTMTHGVDHISREGESPVEDATTVVEKVAFDSVASSTGLEGPHETSIHGGAAMNNAARSHEASSVSGQDSVDCRDKAGSEESEPTVEAPLPRILPATPDNPAVQIGSKLDQSQVEAVLHHGVFIEQDSSNSLLESSSAEGIPAEEELPAVVRTASINTPLTENRDGQAQEPSLNLMEESRQPSDENDLKQHSDSLRYQGADLDVVGDEDSWSEDDSQHASYSQNESIEVDSAANTSIGSVLPPSTEILLAKNGIYLDQRADSSHNTVETRSGFEDSSHVVNFEGANPSRTTITTHFPVTDESHATTKAEIPHGDADDDHRIDDLGPMHAGDAHKSQGVLAKAIEDKVLPGGNLSQGDDASLQVHQFPIKEGDSSALQQNNNDGHDPEASCGLDDSRFQENHIPSFRDDGDPASHYEHGEECDAEVLTSNSPFQSPKQIGQLGWNDDTSGFVLGHSNPDTESQSFMTPLASANFHAPMQFQEWHDSQGYESGRFDNVDSQYVLEDQQATTVRGQDDLFNDDDHSEDRSPEATSDSDPERNDRAVHQDGSATPICEQFAERTSNVDERQPETAVLEDTEAEGSLVPYTPNKAAGSGPDDHIHRQSSISEITAIGTSLEDLSSVATKSGDTDMMTTPRLGPQDPLVTPQMISLRIRPDMTATPSKGLASSRHNPARPRTPEHQIGQAFRPEYMESDTFAPVDVTNIPWDARRDSTPRSLHSQSTLSSSPSSPIHSSLAVEPVIRDSWSTPSHDRLLLSGMGRSRNDSQLSSNGDFEPFRYDPKTVTAQWQQREVAESSSNGRTTPHRNSIASSSPGGLFQKMRSIFEPAGGASAKRSLPSSGRNSPVWTRAANGAPHSSSRNTSGVAPSPTRPAGGIVTRDGDGYDSASERRGGNLFTEAVTGDEADERSSLLNSSYEDGMEVN